MRKLDKLNYKFMELTKNNKDGSYGTRSNRLNQLKSFGRELNELGFVLNKPQSLKPKHVEALVSSWKNKELNTGTIKNRMATIRWWAEKVGKQGVVRQRNEDYNIENRVYVRSTSKGKSLDSDKFDMIPCSHVRGSLLLQREFGLRREEAIKFSYQYAYQKDHIKLKGTWCKGGKERTIPIKTEGQKKALEYVKKNGSNGNLIPSSKNYIQQLRRYERYTSLAGLNKMHGLRHEFAQKLYRDITKMECPANGGTPRGELTGKERAIDTQARMEISRVLGHERIGIVAIYLGG